MERLKQERDERIKIESGAAIHIQRTLRGFLTRPKTDFVHELKETRSARRLMQNSKVRRSEGRREGLSEGPREERSDELKICQRCQGRRASEGGAFWMDGCPLAAERVGFLDGWMSARRGKGGLSGWMDVRSPRKGLRFVVPHSHWGLDMERLWVIVEDAGHGWSSGLRFGPPSRVTSLLYPLLTPFRCSLRSRTLPTTCSK